MSISRKRLIYFSYMIFLTVAIEALIAYIFYELLLRRGYVYTFRVPVSTNFVFYKYILLMSAAVFSAVTIGVFRRRNHGEVETTLQYFLSYLRHPIPLGSLLLFLGTFLFL